jgi:hypothetical protein
MASRDHPFNLATYERANYTAINWIWASDVARHGPPPGFPWARWIGDAKDMPPTGSEAPYMSRLVALSYGDEKDLNDPAVREPYIQWFNDTRARYPNAILYANNYGGQVNDAALADFIARGKPDMVCFDTYPWRQDYQTRAPAATTTLWFSELRRYREHARQSNVPLGTYRQSFHAVQDYDRTVYRDPSASEFYLNTYGALAFNVKFLIDFTYNNGSSSFFATPAGDSGQPTPLYRALQQVNREVRHLGPALVRLKPVEDAKSPDLHTTGVMFIRGKHRDGAGATVLNPIPVGLVPDPADGGYTDWESNRNDPYLRGWEVANLGTKNDELPGDVILSWFVLLDESLDGDKASDEVYLMVTNGLCDRTGGPADCRQRVTLNFADAPATAVMEKLDRQSGRVVDLPLRLLGKRRQLLLDIEGGAGELLKFKTGAPFVGAGARAGVGARK